MFPPVECCNLPFYEIPMSFLQNAGVSLSCRTSFFHTLHAFVLRVNVCFICTSVEGIVVKKVSKVPMLN
jgi:hypothetical protein